MDVTVFATLKKLIGKKNDSTDETVNKLSHQQLNRYGKRIRRKCRGRNGYE